MRRASRVIRRVAEWCLTGLAVDGAALVGIPAAELAAPDRDRSIQRDAQRGVAELERYLASLPKDA